MRALAIAFSLALTPIGASVAQETPKVPKDSVRLVVTGCLKGRVLAVTGSDQPDVQSGPDVTGRSFRLAGKKDVISEVKRHDGNTVRVVGLVRKMDLQQPGMRIGGGRIVVGGGHPTDPTRGSLPDPGPSIAVMDISSVQAVSSGCSIASR